ncbi:MAG: hypothetical protein DCC75_07665 [Proteobacteria bacterium]|nr:MAG: hypothetical protein DCC75_07665 [Pseudomonadota bacterium]
MNEQRYIEVIGSRGDVVDLEWIKQRGLVEEFDRALHDRFPISKWIIVRKTLPSYLITISIGVFACFFFGSEGLNWLNFEELPVGLIILSALLASIFWSAAHTVYLALYRNRLHYGIRDGNFLVTKGLILQEKGAFPLCKIIDIYVNENLLDLIFNLRNLHVTTLSRESASFTRIDGMRAGDAAALKETIERSARQERIIEARGGRLIDADRTREVLRVPEAGLQPKDTGHLGGRLLN